MSEKSNHSLLLRVISALVLMPLVLAAIIYGQLPFLILVAVAILISLYEWTRMAKLSSNPMLHGVLGIVYILVCFACFIYMRVEYIEGGYALCLMFCIWASDIGAYFMGKMIGGPKMAPKISPNKTWAGLFGGMLASGVMFVFYVTTLGSFLSEVTKEFLFITPDAAPFVLFGLGAFMTIIGQIGDLLISWEKRKVGVKDTGNLIPGHGGILDRIDSLLLASPVFLIGMKVLIS